MRINTTTTSTRGKALRRCINPLPTKFSSNSTWTNFHFRISKTKHAPQTSGRQYEIECELRRALGLYILTLFWEVQMHYLFVYFLSMYSDTGVGWNFHRGVENLKTPDNIGWFVPLHLGVKSDWRSWHIKIATSTLSSWRRSKSLSPLSNRDECKEGKLLRQSRPFCTNLEAFD